LLATDQGVRGYLHVINDLCYTKAPNLDLRSCIVEGNASANDEGAVTSAIETIGKHQVATFVQSIAENLASYDWRTSAAPELSEDSRREKLALRGSGGYKELRLQLLEHLEACGGAIGDVAKQINNPVVK